MAHLHALISWLAGIVVAVISWGGYGGIALLMAVESACIPLPSEIVMPFAGYLVSTGRLDLFWVATAGAVGNNIGSMAAYAAGKHGGRAFVARWGRYVLVTSGDLAKAERFFARFGGIAVLACRMLPVVRTFIAFPAGVARMPLARFHLYTFAGSWPWCFALAWVGMKLGDRWRSDPRVEEWAHRLDVVVAAAILAAVVWFIRHKLKAVQRESPLP